MQIVDAQIHIWGTGLPSNMAHRQVTSFTAEEAIAMMDEAGVNAAVIHPVGWDPNSTQMALDAVHKYPGRFAIMGSLPLDEANSRPLVEQWRQTHGMLGLRYLFLSDQERARLESDTLDWFWSACEAASVPVAVLATDSLARLGQIAERHPLGAGDSLLRAKSVHLDLSAPPSPEMAGFPAEHCAAIALCRDKLGKLEVRDSPGRRDLEGTFAAHALLA